MTQTKSNSCPYCGKENDQVEKAPNQPDVTEEHPGKDDVSLCIGCGEPAIFNEDLSVRKPTPDEYAEILRDVTVRKIRTAILMCRHRNN